ncbi:ethylene-responsive transcription factor ERF013-like [Abrus precatorius]|uniref:Ethylene-responsive transcription factor ERF013-like n=1 Tax=Abrus precatorius TaxID=3816 RepID=A0A8B8LP39_ABRPR|nr:ethylene-responsive transcription factor ERF013-like [Abrus precatorius]
MDMEKHAMASAGASGYSSDANPNQTPYASSSVNDNNKLYKGVRKRKWGKWVSEIRLPNSRERIWLGSYDSPEKAARAFDAALYCLRGRHANFNFPDTPCNLEINNVALIPGHQSLTPQEIQEVAAKFANEDPLQLLPLDQEPQRDGNGNGNGNSSLGSKLLSKSDSTVESSSTCTPTTTASSCSTTTFECDGTVQVDHGDMSIMDWTFLNVFDYSNEVVPVASDYALYSELDNMHSGELLYSTPPPPHPFQDNDIEDYDPFYQQSSLWNWNF